MGKTSLNIDRDLWLAFKVHCVHLGVSMTTRLTELIETDMRKHKAVAGVA